MPTTDRPLALVTGASRGIGAEVARQLGQADHAVLVTGRDLDRAEAHAEVLRGEGIDATGALLDIDDADVADAVTDLLGDRTLDALVNNAAAFADWQETATGADLATAEAVVATNLFGTWRVTRGALPALRRSSAARIVNVSSGAGSHGATDFGLHVGPSPVSYAISKAALNGLTAKLAVELGDDGILVNSVDPGLTATAPGMEDMGARPIPEGAASVVWAALLDDDGPTGGFFRDGEPLPW